MDRRPRSVLVAAGVLYSGALAAIAWWPTHVDAGLGVIDWPVTRGLAAFAGVGASTAYALLEVGANVVVFVPFGFLLAGFLPAWRPWRIALVGALASAGVETVQLLTPLDRTGSLVDVAANAVGALLGAAAARIVMRRCLVH